MLLLTEVANDTDRDFAYFAQIKMNNSVKLLENQKLLNLCQCWNNSYFFITITGLHYFKLLST